MILLKCWVRIQGSNEFVALYETWKEKLDIDKMNKPLHWSGASKIGNVHLVSRCALGSLEESEDS